MDRTLKWFLEQPGDVMPMDMCIHMIVSDWFGEYILATMDEYVHTELIQQRSIVTTVCQLYTYICVLVMSLLTDTGVTQRSCVF